MDNIAENAANITVVQYLYCADNIQLKKAIDSIKSLDFLLKEEDPVSIYLDGFFKDTKLFNNYYNEVAKLDLSSKVIYIGSAPAGKADMINKAVESGLLAKYMLYADSDIIFGDCGIFERLMKIYKYHREILPKEIGLVALDQANNNRHNLKNATNIWDIHSSLDTSEIVIYADNCSGVDGSCFCALTDLVKKLPFENDSDHYHNTLFENDYLVVIAPNISISHPAIDAKNKNKV